MHRPQLIILINRLPKHDRKHSYFETESLSQENRFETMFLGDISILRGTLVILPSAAFKAELSESESGAEPDFHPYSEIPR